MTMDVSERELLTRMRNFEDQFVGRKTSSDGKDWVKTIVAFDNSTPIDSFSLLFIGVRNSGEIEPPKTDLDQLQRTLNQNSGTFNRRFSALKGSFPTTAAKPSPLLCRIVISVLTSLVRHISAGGPRTSLRCLKT